VTSQPLAAPRPDSADSFGGAASVAWSFLLKTLAIVTMDLRKLRRDPTELLTRAIQPALWLMV
jgi:ABC-2 type transport system permease protein